MRNLGILTAFALSVGIAVALVMGVRSVPDVKRYLRMRQM